MAKDYYNLLGVPRGASEKDIRQSYRRLARRYHPDVNRGDPKAEARFKEINEAYQVLSNADSRRKYDAYGEHWRHADQFAGQGAGGPFTWNVRTGRRRPTVGPDMGLGDFGDLGGLFGDLFGFSRRRSGTATEKLRQQPQDVPVTITLEEAYHGTSRLVQVPSDPRSGRPGRRLEVKLPPGVDTGSRVHIAAGDARTGRGDLYLAVGLAPHKGFRRKGDDLETSVSVDLADAMLGGEVEVPTIKGTRVALKVPAETQNGRVFRLKGQGMPRQKDASQYGDLLATVKVTLPTKLSEAEQELFRRLREARSG